MARFERAERRLDARKVEGACKLRGARKAMGEFSEAFELSRAERSICNASLDRQVPDILPVPDLDSRKPSQTVRCKKLLVIMRHLFWSGEIEVASDAALKEYWQGAIALVSVHPAIPDISVDCRQYRGAARKLRGSSTNRKQDRTDAARRLGGGVHRGVPASRVHGRRHEGFGQGPEIAERPRHGHARLASIENEPVRYGLKRLPDCAYALRRTTRISGEKQFPVKGKSTGSRDCERWARLPWGLDPSTRCRIVVDQGA